MPPGTETCRESIGITIVIPDVMPYESCGEDPRIIPIASAQIPLVLIFF